MAYKKCSADGHWEGKYAGDHSRPQGWTNYTNCFAPEIKDLLDRLHVRGEEAQVNDTKRNMCTIDPALNAMCRHLLYRQRVTAHILINIIRSYHYPLVLHFYVFLYQIKIQVAQGIRIMEIVGLSVSLLSLLLSLIIFTYFR